MPDPFADLDSRGQSGPFQGVDINLGVIGDFDPHPGLGDSLNGTHIALSTECGDPLLGLVGLDVTDDDHPWFSGLGRLGGAASGGLLLGSPVVEAEDQEEGGEECCRDGDDVQQGGGEDTDSQQ